MQPLNDSSMPGPEVARGEDLLSTGDMARLTGNTLRTVRFYEEAGILRPDRRSAGGHRLFGRAELERLRMITDLRAAGLSLDEIRAMLELKDRNPTAESASVAVAAEIDRQLGTLDQRIEVLSRLRADLLRARAMLDVCRACGSEAFPEACGPCDRHGGDGELPVAMRVLWGVREST